MNTFSLRIMVLALLAGLASVAVASTAVVTRQVEEQALGEPVRVNGVIRSREDLLLPARLDGELTWVVEEGTILEAGALVAKLDDAALALRRSEQELMAERARINLRYLEAELERLARLESTKLASRTQLAEMESRRDLARNDVLVAESRLAQLDEEISRTRIVTPVPAIVTEQLLAAGEFARRGEGVLRILNPGALEVVVTIPASHFTRVSTGQQVKVEVGNLVFPATLRARVAASNPASQTFVALADVPPPVAPRLVAGQFAAVNVPLSATDTSLFVPRDAVVLRSEGSYVYRIVDNVAQRVPVRLGQGKGDLVAVSGELVVGDNVAVRGVERLRDGQEVTTRS